MEQNKILNRNLIPCLGILLVLLVVNSFFLKTFQRKQINSDVIEYYSFVTAVFECKDLSFTTGCPNVYFTNTSEEGKKVNKRSIGMAIMYLPWYGLSQLHARIGGIHDDGYSKATETWLIAGIWIYFLIGMYFLGLSLAKFIPIRSIWALLIILLTGTNLIWYTNGEVLFTHAVNFMWVSILIYFTIRYHSEQKQRYVVYMAIALGMLAIIRPNNLIFVLIPLLYNIYDKPSLKTKLDLLKMHWGHLFLAASIIFLIAVPQLLYWKYASGHWIYYSYQGEKFYWSRPKLMEFLFSFRKGWLIYTPIMIFSILGILKLPEAIKPFKWMLLILVPMFVYISSCWWAWSYGGCFGMRPMVDLYPLLAFPMVFIFYSTKWLKVLVVVPLLTAFIGLNYFQAWQYSKGILHYDQMNFNVYKSIWFKTKYPADYDLLLSYPDYQKEVRGDGAFYSSTDISNGASYVKYIRSGFLQVDTTDFKITSAPNETFAGLFQFIYDFSSKKYLIKQYPLQHYFVVNPQSNMVEASEPEFTEADKFDVIFLGGNKFVLKAPNGYFISSSEGNNFYLKADAQEANASSIFIIKIY